MVHAFVFTDIKDGKEIIVYEGSFIVLKNRGGCFVRPRNDNIVVQISEETYSRFRKSEAAEF